MKGSVTLLDNLDDIVVGSKEERAAVLKVFRKYGIKELADGRKSRDVVLAKP